MSKNLNRLPGVDKASVLNALAGAAEVSGYSTTLKASTTGRGRIGSVDAAKAMYEPTAESSPAAKALRKSTGPLSYAEYLNKA